MQGLSGGWASLLCACVDYGIAQPPSSLMKRIDHIWLLFFLPQFVQSVIAHCETPHLPNSSSLCALNARSSLSAWDVSKHKTVVRYLCQSTRLVWSLITGLRGPLQGHQNASRKRGWWPEGGISHTLQYIPILNHT